MKSLDIPQLHASGVVAVLRAPSADIAVQTVDALVAGGITAVEITYSTPDAAVAIATSVAHHGDSIIVGAGTLTTAAHITESHEAGASFLVCPGFNPDLAETMVGTGALAALGALTPSEVMAAHSGGADVVKIFPAALGGPSYLKALRGPFPDIAMMPTGGVTADNIDAWVAAGVVAVGAGSELCSCAAMLDGDWDDITARARSFRHAWDRAQEKIA